MLMIKLVGRDEEFVRTEARRLGWSPEHVIQYMLHLQRLARERSATPEGQEALRAAAHFLGR